MNAFLVVIELECERECSGGEDYRLIKLTVTDYNVGVVSFAIDTLETHIFCLFVENNGTNLHMVERYR